MSLHEPEDLSAEILTTITPAQATTRHHAKAQVHAFNSRRIHPDLELRARKRKVVNERRIELERYCPAITSRQEVARAQGRTNEAKHRAQDAVVIQAHHRIEPALNLEHQGIGIHRALDHSLGELGLEQCHQQHRDA